MNSYQTLSAYYDRFTDDVGYGQWADFFEQLFAREDIRPQLVLDLACGTGSLTRLLAKRGYDMIGAGCVARNAHAGHAEYDGLLSETAAHQSAHGGSLTLTATWTLACAVWTA